MSLCLLRVCVWVRGTGEAGRGMRPETGKHEGLTHLRIIYNTIDVNIIDKKRTRMSGVTNKSLKKIMYAPIFILLSGNVV
jgi:hypothetical protein